MTDVDQGESPPPDPRNPAPPVPPVLAHPPTEVTPSTVEDGRCDQCGYSLKGLPGRGVCPECGTAYTPESAARLKPWPSAMMICLRMGWPIAGLLVAGSLVGLGNDRGIGILPFYGMTIGYIMVLAVAINSYFQVRSMLKTSLPNAIRTKGPVAVWRKIGTTICVIIMVLFVGGPIACFGCVIMYM